MAATWPPRPERNAYVADLPDDKDDAALTPIQRALKMKQAAIEAKPKPPRGGRFQREQAAAALSSSRSKPWMKKG